MLALALVGVLGNVPLLQRFSPAKGRFPDLEKLLTK
jgi:hypothetical protein